MNTVNIQSTPKPDYPTDQRRGHKGSTEFIRAIIFCAPCLAVVLFLLFYVTAEGTKIERVDKFFVGYVESSEFNENTPEIDQAVALQACALFAKNSFEHSNQELTQAVNRVNMLCYQHAKDALEDKLISKDEVKTLQQSIHLVLEKQEKSNHFKATSDLRDMRKKYAQEIISR